MGCCAGSERAPYAPVRNEEVLNFNRTKKAISEFKNADGEGKLQFKYVIIGNGDAAGYAAHAFVESGKLAAGKLCIIGTESMLPYERPALTKGFMLGKLDLPIFNTCQAEGNRHEQDWYDRNGISMLLGTTIDKVDLTNKVLKTKDGEIEYEKCLAATGSRPLHLKSGSLKGIFYIGSYDDAKALRTRLEEGKSEEKVVLVGGGAVGTEMASCMTEYNFQQVTMVFSRRYVLSDWFPPAVSKIYEDAIEKSGTALLKGKNITGYEGESGHVSAVLLNDGTKLEADIVIVGVGSRPNIELFRDQVAMEMWGIKVDGQMKSSIDGFYACGDVATIPMKYLGKMKRLQHAVSARKTAMQAGRAMLEIQQADIDLVPYFCSRIFDLSCEMYGSKSAKKVFFGFGPDNEVAEIFGCVWLDEESRIVGVLMNGASKTEGEELENHVRQQSEVSKNLLKKGNDNELKAFLLGVRYI